jgi:sulfite exporter TauE/SafE
VSSYRRLIVYVLAGALLGAAGIGLMLVGSLNDNHSQQLAGVLLYSAAIPLLLQAKVAKLESKLEELERELKRRRPEI